MRARPLVAWSFLAVACSLLLSGCFLSNLQPWHEGGTAVADPALVGNWSMKNCSQNEDTKEKFCAMTIAAQEESYGPPEASKKEPGFAIVFTDEKGTQSTYRGWVFEAGGERFLETQVQDGPPVDSAFVVHVVLTNVAWRLKTGNGELSLEPIKLSWAEELKRGGKLPANVTYDNSPVLNVAPKEAAAFLAEHAKDPNAFETPIVWKKGAAAAPRTPKKK